MSIYSPYSNIAFGNIDIMIQNLQEGRNLYMYRSYTCILQLQHVL